MTEVDGQEDGELGGQEAIPAEREEERRVFQVVFPREDWDGRNDSRNSVGGGIIAGRILGSVCFDIVEGIVSRLVVWLWVESAYVLP